MSQPTLTDQPDREHVCAWRVPGEQAALVFVGDQYLFRYSTKSGVTTKFVEPASVSAAFAQSHSIDSGWLPPNVARWGIGPAGEWVVLYLPPAVGALTLEVDASEVSTEMLRVPMPGRVFLGYGMNYFVWAVATVYLAPTAPAFHAPLPNVDLSGRVCFGTKTPPRAAPATIRTTWDLFSGAPFTAHQVNGKSQCQPEDVRVQLRDLARKKRRRYPEDDLILMHRTVDAAIQAVLRSRE